MVKNFSYVKGGAKGETSSSALTESGLSSNNSSFTQDSPFKTSLRSGIDALHIVGVLTCFVETPKQLPVEIIIDNNSDNKTKPFQSFRLLKGMIT